MGHTLLKKAILLLKMANVPFDLLIAVHFGHFKELKISRGHNGPSPVGNVIPEPS